MFAATPQFLYHAPPGAQQLTRPDFTNVPHSGHAIDDVIIDVATVDVAVEVLVDTPVGLLAGPVVGEMVEAVARVVIDVVYTAFITLFSKHNDFDIDPDEPTNISVFRAVE